jgi:hypothetical protein
MDDENKKEVGFAEKRTKEEDISVMWRRVIKKKTKI